LPKACSGAQNVQNAYQSPYYRFNFMIHMGLTSRVHTIAQKLRAIEKFSAT
jgi:hypothetical protein